MINSNKIGTKRADITKMSAHDFLLVALHLVCKMTVTQLFTVCPGAHVRENIRSFGAVPFPSASPVSLLLPCTPVGRNLYLNIYSLS